MGQALIEKINMGEYDALAKASRLEAERSCPVSSKKSVESLDRCSLAENVCFLFQLPFWASG